ncbi:pyridoxal phosphate-dependent aminotransferase [Acidiphilium sp. AL]|uniref:pyridoxal phosphate-dependent aminotransferase n=1 Tax=Acidiphilium sp. AL TaxID=2871704 RepID=UPI0021CB7DC7|nr:pyridoxal phosphate-dependent aminotransferase [Acidiphilium sp. AL]MCU4160836.1 pyridoxal phosphate-dependent aminotransferase [Acidiphilium sp. AL]
MTRFTARIARTKPAATFAMAARARALRAAGRDVISLSIGEPDLPTPPHVIEAAYRAALDGQTRYPPIAGTEALREAVARKFTRDQKLPVGPKNVLITNGGKQAIFNAVMAVIEPDDEVVIPAPCWAGYIQVVEFAGGVPVFVPCPTASGFRLDAAALEAAITPRTKLLLLNYPNNPSGAVADTAMLGAIAAVLRRHPDVLVISDDIYEHLIFDGSYRTLAAEAPDLAGRVLTMSGVSKSYAMTGWRLGFCTGPADWLAAMTLVQGTATAGVSTISQAAAVAALDGNQDLLAERRDIYRRRRDLVLAALSAAPGLDCPKPEGAFYAFPSIAGLTGRTTPAGRHLATDDDVAEALLEEALVATVPGSAFAMTGHIRLSTAAADDALAEACARIVKFCGAIR